MIVQILRSIEEFERNGKNRAKPTGKYNGAKNRKSLQGITSCKSAENSKVKENTNKAFRKLLSGKALTIFWCSLPNAFKFSEKQITAVKIIQRNVNWRGELRRLKQPSLNPPGTLAQSIDSFEDSKLGTLLEIRLLICEQSLM